MVTCFAPLSFALLSADVLLLRWISFQLCYDLVIMLICCVEFVGFCCLDFR